MERGVRGPMKVTVAREGMTLSVGTRG